jgi:GNAT superfamily N-acetyltransferase
LQIAPDFTRRASLRTEYGFIAPGFSGEIHIRPLRPDDIQGVCDLGSRCFSVPPDIGHDHWRFGNLPDGLAPGMVAVHAGAIVACVAAWPAPMRLGAARLRAAQLVNLMTDESYRRLGLFTRLLHALERRLAMSGYDVLYCFPNDQSAPALIGRNGWLDAGEVAIWKRAVIPLPWGIDPVTMVSPRSWSATLRRPVVAIEPADSRSLAGLAQAMPRDQGRCRMERTPRWLSWRYDGASGHHYRSAVARSHRGHALAAVVWRERRDRAFVTETLGSSEGLSDALGALLRHAKRHEIRVIAGLTTDPAVIRALQRNAFWQRRSHPFFVRRLSERLDDNAIAHRSRWLLYGGDHDYY